MRWVKEINRPGWRSNYKIANKHWNGRSAKDECAGRDTGVQNNCCVQDVNLHWVESSSFVHGLQCYILNIIQYSTCILTVWLSGIINAWAGSLLSNLSHTSLVSVSGEYRRNKILGGSQNGQTWINMWDTTLISICSCLHSVHWWWDKYSQGHAAFSIWGTKTWQHLSGESNWIV
jgi:hypothetical protein